MSLIALIDGDVIAYTCGFASETRFFTVGEDAVFSLKSEANDYCDRHGIERSSIEMEQDPEPDYVAFGNVNNLIDLIADETGADDVWVYLSGEGTTFREELEPAYKANRSEAPRPCHLHSIRAYIQYEYPTIITDGTIEADDALGLTQTKHEADNALEDTIICSIDKDLLTIPGWNYNWQRKGDESDPRLTHVSDEDAAYNFCLQLLTGDSVDNIPGLPGIGPKKAERILEDAWYMYGDWERGVTEKYKELHEKIQSKFNRNWYEHLRIQGKLLWILREPGQIWEPSIKIES